MVALCKHAIHNSGSLIVSITVTYKVGFGEGHASLINSGWNHDVSYTEYDGAGFVVISLV